MKVGVVVMLNVYKDKQLMAFNLLSNDIINNCVTHAYLFDENNYSDSFGIVISFVKEILCKNIEDDVSRTILCKRIDDGNYPELKIISADGMYIKKQQIIDLQKEFSRSSVEGKKRIYIIRDCEKMRPEAANSMLKFLEEPEDGIIAILMTNNINNVLSTIISRCKIIKLNSDLSSLCFQDDVLENLAINFVLNLETRGIDTIIDVKDIWFSVLGTKDREKMILVFDIMIDIYYDILNLKMMRNDIKYSKWIDKLNDFINKNSLDNILSKINILLEYKDSIKFNVNSSLLMDSLIISIGGITDDSRY